MADTVVNKVEEKAAEQLDALADRATDVISSAAGAVADPKEGMARAKKKAMDPKLLVVLVVVGLAALLIRRRLAS